MVRYLYLSCPRNGYVGIVLREPERDSVLLGPDIHLGWERRHNEAGDCDRDSKRFPELAPRLPRSRKPWMSEDYRMSIFDAVALALTFFFQFNNKHLNKKTD